MAQGVQEPEGNNGWIDKWQMCPSRPGSESMACSESDDVNVGDPTHSRRMRVSADKCNGEEAEMVVRKSDQA